MQHNEHNQLNVLVVDDDPAIRKLLINIVTREEHQAIPAESAEEILKLLPYWTFQVAFIDHHLSGMEGIVLGEYLRRNNPDMTIALVTGSNDHSIERKCGDLGIEYIQKPFTAGDIIMVIESCYIALKERERRRVEQGRGDFVPPIARYIDSLAAIYNLPRLPSRIEDRLVERLKFSINNLRSPHRFNDRDWVITLAGLLSARVFGIRLPKSSSDLSLYEEYDELMRRYGRNEEFNDQ